MITFIECLQECIKTKDFIKEFNRLTDSSLGVDNRTPIEKMVDNTCGYDEQKEDMGRFVDFVYEFVWLRL